MLRISKISAKGLPDADDGAGVDGGASDPYIVFTLRLGDVGSFTSRTRTKTGRNVEWKKPVDIHVPSKKLGRQAELEVVCWDEDTNDADDLMGTITVPLTKNRGHERNTPVPGHGKLYDFRMSFFWQFYDLTAAEEDSASNDGAQNLGPHVDMLAFLRVMGPGGFRRNGFMSARRRIEAAEGEEPEELTPRDLLFAPPWAPVPQRALEETRQARGSVGATSLPQRARPCTPPRSLPLAEASMDAAAACSGEAGVPAKPHVSQRRLTDPRAGETASSPPRAVLSAAFDGSVSRVAAWLDHGGSVDAQYVGGVTLLMQASGAGHAKLVAELLRRGATVDAVDKWGRTALASALATGQNADTVRVLRCAGAQPELVAPAVLAAARMTAPDCVRALDEAPTTTRQKLTELWKAAAAQERLGGADRPTQQTHGHAPRTTLAHS